MKNSNSYTRGIIKQAVAGLGVALFVSSSSFAIFDDIVTETRDVKPFETVRIAGGMQLEIIVGEKQHLIVKADEDQIADVETIVRDGVLIIGTDQDEDSWSWGEADVQVKITVPSLKALDVRGAVDGIIKGIDAEDFVIDVRGAGKIEAKGKCVNLMVDIAGAAAVEADALKCENVEVSLRGTGFASVYASESVDADLRGVGVIDISGHPKKIERDIRGIGIIND